ncbi:HNH endonuclease [Thalassotalea sp. G2M2-11]|uniref:HNH endonuclease n=1 Tax=Thalassotalea sp. G2M2-11 TaxID=2787627 RepID=UPI0019D209A2|nr:HNH endonuclease [Thalassotalea sp. G2M2-11]
MDIELLRPKDSPRIIDLVAQAGIDVTPWTTNEDGTACKVPASNPKYCYEWCFRDFKSKVVVLNIWFDELYVDNTQISQRLNLRLIADTDQDPNRRRRAATMDSAIRVASLGGWTIRAIIMAGKDRKDGKQEAKARMLDSQPWIVDSYSEDTGECHLVRNENDVKPKPVQTAPWTRKELRASVEAYLEIRTAEMQGNRINKAAVYRQLEERFDRTGKAFEFRMQNISHVLSLMGREWVDGLKPASNVGPTNASIIEELIYELEGNSAPPVAAFEEKIRASLKKGIKSPPEGNQSPGTSSSPVTQFVRDPAVVAWVLNVAQKNCECCKQKAPFEKDDGSPFLEVHHVLRLADGGPDVISNAVALCPNCHRELHYGVNRAKLTERLYESIKRLEKPTGPS